MQPLNKYRKLLKGTFENSKVFMIIKIIIEMKDSRRGLKITIEFSQKVDYDVKEMENNREDIRKLNDSPGDPTL